MTALWIRNGLVVDDRGPYAADVVVNRERIEALGVVRPFGPFEELDARGLWLLPGGVDAHTHLDMPVGPYHTATDFDSGSRQALLGGTTTVLDFANPAPGASLASALEAWHGLADGRASVDWGLHMSVIGLEQGQLDEMAAVVEAGVTSFKVFTTYRGRMMLDDEGIAAVLERARDLGAVVVVHAEDDKPIQRRLAAAAAAGRVAPIDHAWTRPPRTEAAAVRRVIALAAEADAALHVAHLSSAGGADAVAEARALGLDVSGETCPQYLWLDPELLRRDDGAQYLCTPPVRPAQHRQRLWRALRDGDVGAVTTDHCPWRAEDKRGHGAFTDVPNGLPGVGHRLFLLLEGVARRRLSPGRLVRAWSMEPAARFGLAPRKGAIRPGADADIVAVDPAAPTVLGRDVAVPDVADPYDGLRCRGAVRWVMRRGETVVQDGQFLARPGSGRFVARGGAR
jgi:dihydropyrimidinase